jgi:hypothetical protein
MTAQAAHMQMPAKAIPEKINRLRSAVVGCHGGNHSKVKNDS